MTGTDTSLPVEIVEVICEDLISEYVKEAEEERRSTPGYRKRLLPRWFLLPLLRVCKLWYIVSEKYLYQSIEFGGSFPGRLRSPKKISDELLLALEGNSRLAMLVEELRIHWESRSLHFTDARLVKICPCLRNVDLLFQRMDPLETEWLSKALAEKSLVIFYIRLKDKFQNMPLPIYALMQRWPEIQSINICAVGGIRLEGRADSQPPKAVNCCPELREIELSIGGLHESDFSSFRMMCSVVTRLRIVQGYSDIEALDALCGCLHTWSPTLEYLDIVLMTPPTDNYQPLSVALSSLTSLRTLEIHYLHVDVGTISTLPRLKRLVHFPVRRNSRSVMHHLACLLEDPDKFTVLTNIHFEIALEPEGVSAELRDVCCRRNIELRY